MEDILTQINNESNAAKYAYLKKACQDASDLLEDPKITSVVEPYKLREICLHPLRLALESKNTKFVTYALGGMQKMLLDERFLSTMEAEQEDRWLPIQILNAVCNVPNLSEETQVEVLKVLLHMTFTSSWCMNSKVITRITELCFDIYISTTKLNLRNLVMGTVLKLLKAVSIGSLRTHEHNDSNKEVLVAMYGDGPHGSVRTAAQATLTQLLTSLAAKMNTTREQQSEDVDRLICEFTNDENNEQNAAVLEDVIHILSYLCEKLHKSGKEDQKRQTTPLLLEGILAILSNVPTKISESQSFVDIVWQQLCPSLISVLGNPLADKSVISHKPSTNDDQGRGSGCSNHAPNVQTSAAKSVYSISKELIRLVGRLESLRPVLQSLLHRMLLYPPPQHRLDAIKSLKDTLNNPERLLGLAGPTIADRCRNPTVFITKKKAYNIIAPLKLIVDSLQECCHCNDSSVCMYSVNLVNDLVTSLDKLSKGQGVSDELVVLLHKHCAELEGLSSTQSISSWSRLTTTDSEQECQDEGHDSDSSVDSEPRAGHVNQNSYHNNKNQPIITQNTDSVNSSQRNEVRDKPVVVKPKGLVEQRERQSAKDYVDQLLKHLPEWLCGFSCTEVDAMIQNFSSDICAAQAQDDQGQTVILNADGVYVVTHSALLHNLKLIRSGYYESDEKSLHMVEQQFIDDILCTELKLYLSAAWLSEVFHQVNCVNLLEAAGYRDMGREDCDENALVQLLIDIDGLESRKISGQFLCGYRDADTGSIPGDRGQSDNSNPLAVQAGMKFSRQILLVCGDKIVDVLSVLINGKSSCGITSSLAIMFNAKEESRKAQEAICCSLAGLRRVAKLACVLGVQERCGKVFQELAIASCILEDIRREAQSKQKATLAFPSKPKLEKLHAAHALSLDLVLSMGLEMGSHAADCWPHVFRCCAHISELEHTYFSTGSNHKALPQVKNELQNTNELFHYSVDPNDDSLYCSMMTPTEHVAPTINVTDLINKSKDHAGWDSTLSGRMILTAEQTSKVVCALSQQVDKLFELATSCLNEKALVNFLAELCKASQHQLASFGRNHELQSDTATNALHLYRLGDVLLRCMRGDRPLLHIMKCWAVVSPHLIEAACHKDSKISKKAVNCIHDTVTWLLGNREEMAFFHFNELLCKPFENLVCLELCDGDIQDLIVCSLCELVEACTSQIRSGWRPLFAALRAIRIKYTTNEEINEARQRHITAVLDVFDVFLNTENTLVFANAALDCIQCLHKYVRGQGEFEELADDDSDSGSDLPSTSDNLILPALQYLKKCCLILSSMWNMPACPVFHSAKSIQTASPPLCVDPVIPGFDFDAFQKPFKESQEEQSTDIIREDISADLNSSETETESEGNSIVEEPNVSGDNSSEHWSADSQEGQGDKSDSSTPVTDGVINKPNTSLIDSIAIESKDIALQKENLKALLKYYDSSKGLIAYTSKTLDELDKNTGVLHVWYLVLEGLAGMVAECPRNYQPQALEMLFELLRLAADVPGAEFALHCMNHLLLPTLQAWLRKGNQIIGYWNNHTISNFKHCFGLCADLVVEYIIQFANDEDSTLAVEFMLKQTMDLMTECIAQPFESLSRLGCACIRHSILSCGEVLSEKMWHIAVTAIQHACDVTLYCLKQLMTPFQQDSDNFYGDMGQVKVAVRKDCSGIECERLRQLAQQVFLLDVQRSLGLVVDYEVEEDRSYIFLIYPPGYAEMNDPSLITRVPFRSIVVGLLSHQILIQIIGCLLLQKSSNMVPLERDVINSSLPGDCTPESTHSEPDLIQDAPLPGMMRYMSCRNVMTLLDCLSSSFTTAKQFDLRPGLKFLMQKVARSDVATNLYKQMGVSTMFYVHTLLEITTRQDDISIESIKRMLSRTKLESSLDDSTVTQTPTTDLPYSHNNEVVRCSNLQSDSETSTSESAMPTAEMPLTLLELATHSKGPIQKHMNVFGMKLKFVFDAICTNYIDMYLEKEGPNQADKLSKKLLVFLVAADDMPSLKRDKSLREMVEEKLKEREENTAKEAVLGPMLTQTVQQQEDNESRQPPDMSESGDSAEETMVCGPMPAHEDLDDRVYSVATDKTINSLMSQYKKRKQAQTMPTFVKQQRSSHIKAKSSRKAASSDPVERQIEQDHKASIMKDSEAHLNAYIEMICNILQLYHQLPDHQFRALLPLLFNFMNQLECHCGDRRLRDTLARWIFRIGHMYGFATLDTECPTSKYD